MLYDIDFSGLTPSAKKQKGLGIAHILLYPGK